MSDHVEGYCPMGCGQTLFLGADERITCCGGTCLRPTAADELLRDGEHEHIVQLDTETFTIKRPLRERLDGALMTCTLPEWIAAQSEAPATLGRYRVVWRGNPRAATWVRIGEPEARHG